MLAWFQLELWKAKFVMLLCELAAVTGITGTVVNQCQ